MAAQLHRTLTYSLYVGCLENNRGIEQLIDLHLRAAFEHLGPLAHEPLMSLLGVLKDLYCRLLACFFCKLLGAAALEVQG